MAAAQYRLDNLVAIVDQNGFQLSGSAEDIMPLGDMRAKLDAFGWQSEDVDGHDIAQLVKNLSVRPVGKPLAIVAHTVKGKGFSFSENNNDWHHAVVTSKFYEQGMAELENGSGVCRAGEEAGA